LKILLKTGQSYNIPQLRQMDAEEK